MQNMQCCASTDVDHSVSMAPDLEPAPSSVHQVLQILPSLKTLFANLHFISTALGYVCAFESLLSKFMYTNYNVKNL